jgi:ribose transport system permease protein
VGRAGTQEKQSRTGFDLSKVRNWGRQAGVLFSLLLVVVLFSLLNRNFLQHRNIINILQQASINAIVGFGMTIVIITGGIDLSVGSIVALTSIAIAKLMVSGVSIPLALLAGIVLGGVCGALNGVLISKVKLQPFLVTLGTMSLYCGFALIYSNGIPIINLPSGFLTAMNRFNRSIPLPIIIMFFVTIVLTFALKKTLFGAYVFAIGGNEEATRLSGVNVDKYKIITYAVSGITCAIAGIIFLGRLAAAEPMAGNGYELDAIGASAIGGASLAGGKGSIFGTIIGALILSALRNGLTLMNVQAFYQYVAIGVIIIIAVTIDRYSDRS